MDFAFQWDLSENRSKKILGVRFYPQGQKHFERLKGHVSLSEFGVVPVDVVDVIFKIKQWYHTDEDGGSGEFNENHDQEEEEDYDDDEEEKDDDDEEEEETGMSPANIYNRFYRVVNDAVMKLRLLPDWEHGGFASPACTGIRQNGPALMMQFNYNKENGESLKLTVDLVLAMDVREIYDGDLDELCSLHMGSSWQHELLRKKHYLDKLLTKIHVKVLLDTTFPERMWLSTMDIDHPVKIAVRIFKILNQIALEDPNADLRIDLYSVDEKRMMMLKRLRRYFVLCVVSTHIMNFGVKSFIYNEEETWTGDLKHSEDIDQCLCHRS